MLLNQTPSVAAALDWEAWTGDTQGLCGLFGAGKLASKFPGGALSISVRYLSCFPAGP